MPPKNPIQPIPVQTDPLDAEHALLQAKQTHDKIAGLETPIEAIAKNTIPKDVQKVEIGGFNGQPAGIDDFQKSFWAMLRGPEGKTPVKGTDYFTPEEIDAVIAKAVEQAKPVKGKDYFTPQDFKQFIETVLPYVTPEKGIHYNDGAAGYTPVKGLDYTDGRDGKDGKNGKDGRDGEAGPQGRPGEDGSPDSGGQIKTKLEKLKVGLDYESLSNKPDMERVYAIASKTPSLSELDDVNLSNLTIVNGKYVFGPTSTPNLWMPPETPQGAINSSNLSYSLSYVPLLNSGFLFVNGYYYDQGTDYTITGNVITMTVPLDISLAGSPFRFKGQYYSSTSTPSNALLDETGASLLAEDGSVLLSE